MTNNDLCSDLKEESLWEGNSDEYTISRKIVESTVMMYLNAVVTVVNE